MTLPETLRARRGHDFYPPAGTVPALYSQESVPTDDQVLAVHYFAGGSDWWLTEWDPASGIGFGYACLNGDASNAEWGETYLPELEAVLAHGGLLVVERDLHWEPVKVRDAALPGHRASV